MANLSTPSSSGTSTPRSYHDDLDSDEVQAEIATTRNESPSSAIPIPRGDDVDVERADDLATTLVNDQPSAYSPRRGWRALASRNLLGLGGESSSSLRQAPSDRNR